MNPIILTTLSLGSIAIISALILSPSTNSETTSQKTSPILISSNNYEKYPPDLERINKMARLLSTASNKNYEEYKQLCKLATYSPQIGMNISQTRSSTWCFPYRINTIQDIRGYHIQEIYMRPSESNKVKYLYFSNNVLISIQE